MAKVLLGPIIGQISGSIGGATYSHNRFGYYIRQKTKPVLITTAETSRQRSLFQDVTSDWQGLLAASQNAWRAWAQNNPVTDALGSSQILSGHQAYMRLNLIARRNGATTLALPPVTSAPNPLTACSVSASIAAGIDVTFTPTPLPAYQCLNVRAALVNSHGIAVVKSLFKLIYYGIATTTSPTDISDSLIYRFGSLTVGQVLHVSCNVADMATGLTSVPRIANVTLTA